MVLVAEVATSVVSCLQNKCYIYFISSDSPQSQTLSSIGQSCFPNTKARWEYDVCQNVVPQTSSRLIEPAAVIWLSVPNKVGTFAAFFFGATT